MRVKQTVFTLLNLLHDFNIRFQSRRKFELPLSFGQKISPKLNCLAWGSSLKKYSRFRLDLR